MSKADRTADDNLRTYTNLGPSKGLIGQEERQKGRQTELHLFFFSNQSSTMSDALWHEIMRKQNSRKAYC